MKFDKPIQDGLKDRKILEKKKKKFSTIFAKMFQILHSGPEAGKFKWVLGQVIKGSVDLVCFIESQSYLDIICNNLDNQ